MYNNDVRVPRRCVIDGIFDETADARTLTLKFADGSAGDGSSESDFLPGQFVLLAAPGVDETPVPICSSPTDADRLEVCVRGVGEAGVAIHKLGAGDELSIRGPFGNHFPVGELFSHDLLFVAGGLGLAPLRSLIRYVFAMRKDFGAVTVLYGAHSPGEMVFARELDAWREQPDTEVLLTIDGEHPKWIGRIGAVTTLFDEVAGQIPSRLALVSGSPAMLHSASSGLLDHGTNPENMYLTLERHMKCGAGTCGHCRIGDKHVCQDGPVFTCLELEQLE